MVRFVHSTKSDNLAALRQRFPAIRGISVARIARWLLAHCTDAQLKAMFGVGDAGLIIVKEKLQAHADKLTAVEELEGE